MRLYEFDGTSQSTVESTLLTLLQYFLPKSTDEEVSIPVETILSSMQAVSPGFSISDLEKFQNSNPNIQRLISNIDSDTITLSNNDEDTNDSEIDDFGMDSMFDDDDSSEGDLNDLDNELNTNNEIGDEAIAPMEFPDPNKPADMGSTNRMENNPQPMSIDPATADSNLNSVAQMAKRATKRRT